MLCSDLQGYQIYRAIEQCGYGEDISSTELQCQRACIYSVIEQLSLKSIVLQTYDATELQTYDATELQAYDATELQTYDATELYTYDATELYTYEATEL